MQHHAPRTSRPPLRIRRPAERRPGAAADLAVIPLFRRCYLADNPLFPPLFFRCYFRNIAAFSKGWAKRISTKQQKTRFWLHRFAATAGGAQLRT
jgi:hypothetical protein